MSDRQLHPSNAPTELLLASSAEPACPRDSIRHASESSGQHGVYTPPVPRMRGVVAVLLFLATCASTFLVGLKPGGGLDGLVALLFNLDANRPDIVSELLRNGATYAGAILSILGAHEMGHFLQARRYGVPASYPYFIPFPISFFGTMGAVIVQGGGVANRKMLYDIAISGPLAGLVFALPIAWLGVQQAEIGIVEPGEHTFGDPLLIQWMSAYHHGALEEGTVLNRNPLLFAGWVGIFITAFNLIPIGQLDGGHILYTLIGRRAHLVARLLIWTAAGLMIWTRDYSYSVIVVLLILMGPKHPPTADDRVPLGMPRIILGWLTLAFIIVGFTPTPISQVGPEAKLRPAVQERPDRVAPPAEEAPALE